MARVSMAGRKRVVFTYRGEPGQAVFVAGSFNNWDPRARPLADRKGDGSYAGALMLPRGQYQYKLVVNGAWCVDPANPEWMANDMGTLNSVLRVE